MTKFHYTPSQFANLSLNEKAFVIAVIDKIAEEEKKAQQKIKSARRR